MCRQHQKDCFHFPEINNDINIYEQYNSYDWRKANSLEIGSNGSPKITVLGQHYKDILYMYYKIHDNSLRNGDDRLTLCLDSNSADELNPENLLLGCELTFDDNGGSLSYLKYNNELMKWEVVSYSSTYIEGMAKKDDNFEYWDAIVKVNFTDLKKDGFNTDSFGLFFKILDYANNYDFIPFSWPASAQQDEQNPSYIPPHEQWAIGCFDKQPFWDRLLPKLKKTT